MKRLQQEVDAPLFRKDGRKLGLTEAGEIVLRYGRRMLELEEEERHEDGQGHHANTPFDAFTRFTINIGARSNVQPQPNTSRLFGYELQYWLLQ
jgi:DNA-binding transcriptional LysR family regulator